MTSKPFFERVWVIPLLMLVITVLFFSHVILPSENHALPGDDFEHQFYPWFRFVARTIQDTGELPLWNPHQFLGYNIIANPQYALLYPPNWFIFLAGADHVQYTLGLVLVAHAFWAGLGMAYLMRSWGVKPLIALTAGVLIASGGYLTARTRAGHYSLILAFAWVPWIMAAYRLAVQKRRTVWTIPGGMALGLCVLAGYPQMVYFLGMALALQWGYETLADPDRPSILFRTRQLALIGLIGLLLSAALWLPVLENLPEISRTDQGSLIFANEHALPANRLATLAIPHLFGARVETETPPGYWGDIPHFEETLAYIGLLPLIALALLPNFKDRRLWFFGGLAVFGLLISLGLDGVLWMALYRWLPFFRSFRGPGRIMGITSIGLAGLLALTVTRLGHMSLDERRELLRPVTARGVPAGLAFLWGGALVLTAASTGLEPGDQSVHIAYMAEQFALSGIFLALAGFALWTWTADADRPIARWALVLTLVVAVADVWHIAWPLTYTTEMPLSMIWQDAAVDVPIGAEAGYGRVMQMYPPGGITNGATWTGHQTTQGYDPIAPDGWTILNRDAGWNPASPVNRLLGVRYALSGAELSAYGFPNIENFELIGIRGPNFFFDNTDALPRAYLVNRYAVEPNDDLAYKRITDGELWDGNLALLVEDPGCDVSGDGGTATITTYEPNQVVIETNANGPGMLVLSDEYDDDWQVEIDGQSADLRRADVALRAVCVPEGVHTVRFMFRPWTLYAGGVVSLVGWALALGLGGWFALRKRSPAIEEPAPADHASV
ncbi:MAG: YfhO family protein [Anaerolineae bacterium]|nr:YfhO family protein [Anaerolineae bacterium]